MRDCRRFGTKMEMGRLGSDKLENFLNTQYPCTHNKIMSVDGVEPFLQSLMLGSSDPLQNFFSPKFTQSCPMTRASQGHLDLESLPGSAINLDTPI